MSGLARAAVTEDLLILVDAADHEIGTLPKTECHLGAGTLHRAFSVFLFDADGQVLIQERAAGKMLWPGYWSNSCCSHPRPGEATGAAAQRRVREELQVESEHELCHVYAGLASGTISTDPLEIAAIRWVSPTDLSREIAADPERFSPWMKLEWQQITAHHLDRILNDCRKQTTWRT
jgi:isopentenyl-diphosphate delta-isomerase